MVRAGQLLPENLVRQGTSGKWVTASRVKGLFPSESQQPESTKAVPPKTKTKAKRAAALPDESGELAANIPLDDLGASPLEEGALAAPDPTPVGLPVGAVASATQRTTPAPQDLQFEQPAEQSSPARTSHKKPSPISDGRVGGLAVLSIGIGFAGLCTATFPLLPIALGGGAALLGMRAIVLAPKRNSTLLGLAMVAVVLSIAAIGWGTYTTMQYEKPLEALQQKIYGLPSE